MRGGLSVEDALMEAKRLDEARQMAGFDQMALDDVARQGLGNGAFEEGEEDSGAVVEEFFPEVQESATAERQQTSRQADSRSPVTSLNQKLEAKSLALVEQA